MMVLSLNMCACPCLRGDGYEGAVTNIHNWRYKQPLKEKRGYHASWGMVYRMQ